MGGGGSGDIDRYQTINETIDDGNVIYGLLSALLTHFGHLDVVEHHLGAPLYPDDGAVVHPFRGHRLPPKEPRQLFHQILECRVREEVELSWGIPPQLDLCNIIWENITAY